MKVWGSHGYPTQNPSKHVKLPKERAWAQLQDLTNPGMFGEIFPYPKSYHQIQQVDAEKKTSKVDMIEPIGRDDYSIENWWLFIWLYQWIELFS